MLKPHESQIIRYLKYTGDCTHLLEAMNQQVQKYLQHGTCPECLRERLYCALVVAFRPGGFYLEEALESLNTALCLIHREAQREFEERLKDALTQGEKQ